MAGLRISTLNDSSPANAHASAGELYAVIRPRALRGPYRGGSTESRGLHGCAYADGSRASWRDGGCSAGKYACSYFVSLIFAVRALTGVSEPYASWCTEVSRLFAVGGAHTQQHNFRRVAGVNQVLFAFFRVIPGSFEMSVGAGGGRFVAVGVDGGRRGEWWRGCPRFRAAASPSRLFLGITQHDSHPPQRISCQYNTLDATYPQVHTLAIFPVITGKTPISPPFSTFHPLL